MLEPFVDHAGHVLVKGTTALIDLAETASDAEKGTSAPIDEVRTLLFLIPEVGTTVSTPISHRTHQCR